MNMNMSPRSENKFSFSQSNFLDEHDLDARTGNFVFDGDEMDPREKYCL